MARKSSACGDDIVAIEELMQDLETRLRRLNKTKAAASGAASAGGEFVIETLAGIVSACGTALSPVRSPKTRLKPVRMR
jgi:hypothetical protein